MPKLVCTDRENYDAHASILKRKVNNPPSDNQLGARS